MIARRSLREGEIEIMYSDAMPDHRTECIIYRCDDESDTGPVSDDYGSESGPDSPEVDN